MGMNVYAYAHATNGQQVPIMFWRKPYPLANWLFQQLPAEEQAAVKQQRHQIFVIYVTKEMLATIEAKAEAEPESTEGKLYWRYLVDADFFWRAEVALGDGFEVSILVDP